MWRIGASPIYEIRNRAKNFSPFYQKIWVGGSAGIVARLAKAKRALAAQP
jgi:hypothetical protein